MTDSAIKTTINDQFPVQGVTNDSQVFRDNFATIKTSLASAKTEIEQFLNHGVRDDAAVSSLNGNILSTCVMKATAEYRHAITGLQVNNFNLDYNNGLYQNVKVGANLTINLVNFPTDTTDNFKVGKVRLHISADSTDRKVEFTATNAALKYDSNYPFVDTSKITIKGSVTETATIVDIWQVNNGTLTPSIYIKHIGSFQYNAWIPPQPRGYVDNVGAVQNPSSSSIKTDDTKPGILIGANITKTIKLYINGTETAAVYNSTIGSLTPNAELSPGVYSFAYTLTDALGNESGLSAALNITIDTEIPTIVSVTPSWGFVLDATDISTDGTIDVTTTGVENNQIVTTTLNSMDYHGTILNNATSIVVPLADLTALTNGNSYNLVTVVSDLAGNPAVSNTTSFTVDTISPALQTAAVSSNGLNVVLTYSETLSSTTAPASAFTVTVDNTPATISSAVASNSTVTLTLATAIQQGQDLKFCYIAPQSGNAIKDLAGNKAVTIPLTPLTNSSTVDTISPVLQSVTVVSTGLTVDMLYNEPLNATTAPTSAFAVSVDNSPATVSGVSVTNNTVSLTLATAIQQGQTVNVTYTAPSGNAAIKDSAGNKAITIAMTGINNSTVVVDSTSPVLQSVATDTTGLNVILTYDEPLNATTAPTTAFVVSVNSSPVTVSGVSATSSHVTLTLAIAIQQNQTVSMSYTAPSGTDAIKDLAGNKATSLTMTGINNSTATNGGSGGTVPTTPTSAPASYVDNSGPVTSDTSTASTTDDTTPGINIPTGLTDTVKLYNGNTYIPATYNSATGALTPDTALPDGNYDFKYTLSNQAGESGKSPAINITIAAIDGGWYATKQIPSRRDGTNLASDRIYGIALLSGNYATVSTQFDMPGVFHGSLTYYTNNAITHQINLQDITDTWLHCTSVAIDSSNNVYITGDISRDGFVRKYSSTGTLLWAKKLDLSTSNSWYRGYASVHIDHADNMILVGNYGIDAFNNGGTNPGFIAKYSSSNVLQWATSLADCYITGCAITNTNTIGVVGSRITNFVVAASDNAGNLLWKRINTHIGTANITDVSIAADSNNNFYISGTKSSDGGVSPRNAFVVKYSPTGSLLWTKALSASADSHFYAIDVDSSNIIHVVGSCDGGGLYATYDASGTLLSKRVFTNLSIFSDIKVDSSNVYISYNIFPNGLEYASGVITLDRVTGNNILGTTAVDITITDASAITEFELTFTDTDATDLVSSPLTITSFPDDTAITQTTDIELTVTGGQAR
jgi:uncharacterized repeat protein (TIGR02059 family)